MIQDKGGGRDRRHKNRVSMQSLSARALASTAHVEYPGQCARALGGGAHPVALYARLKAVDNVGGVTASLEGEVVAVEAGLRIDGAAA